MRASWRRPPAASDALFVLTHNYSGYPMIRQARDMVLRATSATSASCKWNIRRTGWPEAGGQRPETGENGAPIRRAPASAARSAISARMPFTSAFVTGLEAEALCADLDSFVEGRQLDDNCACAAALQGRREGHAVGKSGRARPRERPALARLRRRRAGWSGCRKTRTISGIRRSASRAA
jgi:hypothetical protein